MTQVKPDTDCEIPVAQAVMTQHWEATSGSQPALPTSAPAPTKQTPLKSNPFVSPPAVFLLFFFRFATQVQMTLRKAQGRPENMKTLLPRGGGHPHPGRTPYVSGGQKLQCGDSASLRKNVHVTQALSQMTWCCFSEPQRCVGSHLPTPPLERALWDVILVWWIFDRRMYQETVNFQQTA